MNTQQLAIVEQVKKAVMGDGLREEIRTALPKHVPVDRFRRVLLTSITHDTRLLEADPYKVMRAALKVAPLGLLTDPMLGEAYLIVDGNKDVQVRIGYRGLIKLARQSGEVAAIYAHEVCRNDEFTVVLGDRKALNHKPEMFGERGAVVGYYAVVKYRSGETDFEIMTIDDINKIREKSDGYKAFKAGRIKTTPWESAYDEMAKKTALRRLLKRVPASADLADAMSHESEQDDREYGGNGRMRDVTPERPAIAEQPMQAPQYVELTSAHGEVFLLEPGAVEAWIKEQIEGATDEELEALAEHNEHEAVLAAIAAELEQRAAQEPAQASQGASAPAAQEDPDQTLADAQRAEKAEQQGKRKRRAQEPQEPAADFTREVEASATKEWTRETAIKRANEIIAILKDHGGNIDTLDEAWSFYGDDIRTMPPEIQAHLNRAYSQVRAILENPGGRVEDERQQELV